MSPSTAILNKILKTEGFKATAYADGMTKGVQLYSIGYGHQIQPSEQTLKRSTITKSQALELFKKDNAQIIAALNQSKRKLNQNQYDALFDFAFNCGTGALSAVLATWNDTGSMAAVTAQMTKYNKSTKIVNGVPTKVVNDALVDRRKDNVALFNKPFTAPALSIAAIVGIAALFFLRG
ncbi:lysozyme [Mucilaginibacter sp.]